MNPNNPPSPLRVDGFVFDLDGTIYLGDAALPGAVDCIHEMRRRGKKIVFVSNKPLAPRSAYAEKLTRLGIPTQEDEILTSAVVLARYLNVHEPSLRLYVIGEEYLKQELSAHGLTVVEELVDQDPKGLIDPVGIDAVVVAFDRTLDYRKLNTAFQALNKGARFFATNPDKTCPVPGGAIPDAGATLAALEHLTGRTPELIAGKPSVVMMQVALESLALPPAQCMIIGDRLETDIRMGQQAGMLSAVVLTGVSTRQAASSLPKPPDLILDQIDELIKLTT